MQMIWLALPAAENTNAIELFLVQPKRLTRELQSMKGVFVHQRTDNNLPRAKRSTCLNGKTKHYDTIQDNLCNEKTINIILLQSKIEALHWHQEEV